MSEQLDQEERQLAVHLLHHAPHYAKQVTQLLEQAATLRAEGQHGSLTQLLLQQRILSAGDLVQLLRQVRAGDDPEDHDPPYSLIDTQPEAVSPEGTAGTGLHTDFHMYGRYDALQELARGGMGIVYRATDRETGQQVALKVLKSGDQATGDEIDRFHREVEAMQQLDHPHIVEVLGHGEDRGRYFYAMEFIEGTSLDELHMRADFTPQQAATILLDVARALQVAHAVPIIHRDLKPANILIDQQGQARLTDFGLAKILTGSVLTLTASGMTLGTPYYMAPEQVDDRGEVDPRTDIYALGVVLYQCLTGQLPFTGSQANLFYKILETDPEPPRKIVPDIHIDLETICLKAMVKKKEFRYQTMAQLGDDLEKYLAGQTIEARRSTLFTRFSAQARRQRKSIFGALAMVLLLSPLLFWMVRRQFRAAEQARTLASAKERAQQARTTSRIQELLTRARTQREPALALSILRQTQPLYTKLGRQAPPTVLALEKIYRGQLARERQELEIARQLLADAAQLDPESYTAHRELATVLLALDRSKQAQAAFKKAQRLARKQADSLVAESQRALARGLDQLALALLSEAIEVSGSAAGAREYLMRGRIYLAHGLAHRALADFERGGASEPALLAQVRALRSLGQLPEALRRLRARIKAKPSLIALAALGELYHQLGQHRHALEASSQAGDLLGQVRSLVELQQYHNAASVCASLWKTGKITPQARYYKGRLLRTQGMHDAARKLLEQAARSPHLADAAGFELARLELATGRPKPAVARLQRIRGGAERLTLLGQALQALGRHQEATQALNNSIERFPYTATPYLLRGKSLTQLGRTDEAHLDFVRAYSLDNLNFSTFEHIVRNILAGRRMEELPRLNATLQRFRFELDPDDLSTIFAHSLRQLLTAKSWRDRRASPTASPSKKVLDRSLKQLASTDQLERSLARATLLSGGATALEVVTAAKPTPALTELRRELTEALSSRRRTELEDLLTRFAAGRYLPAGRTLFDGSRDDAPLLRAILTDGSADTLVRLWAGQVLARERKLKTIAWMRNLALGRDVASGLIAGWVLRKMQIATGLPAQQALRIPDPSLQSLALLCLTPAESSLSIPFLDHADPSVRYAAGVSLLRAGDQRGLVPLAELQKDADPLVRRLGIIGLAARSAHDNWPLLPLYQRALADTDPALRAFAARVINHLRDPRAADLLLQALKRERHPAVRSQMILGVLGAHTSESKKHVAGLLDDVKQATLVRSTALYALLRWMRDGDFSVMPNWKQLVTTEPDSILRCACLLGLAQYLPPLAQHYLRINIKSGPPEVRGLAAISMLMLPTMTAQDKRLLVATARSDTSELTRGAAWVSIAVLAHAKRLELPNIWAEISRLPVLQRYAVAEGLARMSEISKITPPAGTTLPELFTGGLRRATKIWPENVMYHWQLAKRLIEAGKLNEASAAMARASKLGITHPAGYRTRARLSRLQKQLGEAARNERLAVKYYLRIPFPVIQGVSNPVNPTKALVRAATDHLHLGERYAAMRVLRRARLFQIGAIRWTPFWELSRLLARNGDPEGVIEILSEARQLKGSLAKIRKELKRPEYSSMRNQPAFRKLGKTGR